VLIFAKPISLQFHVKKIFFCAEKKAKKRGKQAPDTVIFFISGSALKEYLVPLVRGTTVATKAALLSPESVDIGRYLTEKDVKECWKEIKNEALLLLDSSEIMKEALKQACKAQVALARARLASVAELAVRPDWQTFWRRYQTEVPLFVPVHVHAYQVGET
jgi:hypothetical protein